MQTPASGQNDTDAVRRIGSSIAYWNLPAQELVKRALDLGQGTLSDTGALIVDTGTFTGRSPKDRFIVAGESTEHSIFWSDINQKFDPKKFDALCEKISEYVSGKKLYACDASVCADPAYRLRIRIITEHPWQSLFAQNLFIRPSEEEIKTAAVPDWQVISVPEFFADPEKDGTRQKNFTIINFERRTAIIGGTAYAGEIKKAVFSVLNYLLPFQNVLPMHCSANIGRDGETAIFFGLSGTGKTTLSTDPGRMLIGDDEHGWTADSVFNFEGGCYAKCANLSKEEEPDIWNAIAPGTVLENVRCFPGTDMVDFSDISKTENTRAAYPLRRIPNAVIPSMGKAPKNIFFLSADAYGVLPPIAKLTKAQAMYYFLSGYTAKVAGTEMGVTNPEATFSACFGKVFLPLAPTAYAKLLGEKLNTDPSIAVWLVNTGWLGERGERIPLETTRAIVSAALSGALADAEYETLPIFHLAIPKSVEGVPVEILNPRTSHNNVGAYGSRAQKLAEAFAENFKQYAAFAGEEIGSSAPKA